MNNFDTISFRFPDSEVVNMETAYLSSKSGCGQCGGLVNFLLSSGESDIITDIF
jgi:hypothetical protein